ncbi:MAG TPA: hypothetical protein PK385_00635 [Spirochaetota bacterium]|nr:hypothetical protein [Spirochaetota bacterium]HOS31751.1 hypothetical protein [Spirochaetota bacterium]HOS54543.1 hypothetical protein [Spirochaetota bacterium]HPK60815.1 hypothetical protein [Spirochaetota bacterium]HQF77185.1 hypothetical protein [Spirochaetota bacterium]
MLHRYHFVLNYQLKARLIDEASKRNLSASKFVRYIFKKLDFVLEQIQLKASPTFFKYQIIQADENLTLNLDKECYFWISEIQDCLKMYSKAQLVRTILQFFFDLKDLLENKTFVSFLQAWSKNWEEEKKNKRKWDKSHMRLIQSQKSAILSKSASHELCEILLI